MGNAERLSLYLAHFPLSAEEDALPEGDSTTVALRYGVESAQTGNLLDLAVANDDTETAAVLLQNGVTASPLLLKKLQASPTTLSDEMLALLGSYRYFGVLDEVLAEIFGCEDALIRPNFVSGTHTLTVALLGELRGRGGGKLPPLRAGLRSLL